MAEEKVEIKITSSIQGGGKTKKEIEDIDKGVKKVGKSSKQTEKSVSSLNSTLKKIAAAAGLTIIVRGFANIVKGALSAAGAMEQVNIAFTTMLGSAEAAATLQKDLIEFAKKTPFELKGIFGSTKQLLAYGIAQKEIIPTMETLGNIAAGVGVPMERLALVFGQVKTMGRLLGQDLNQFAQSGVPLLDALSKSLGVSKAEVMKLKEEGKISFDDVKTALESLTKEGGAFFNLMENQSKTFVGVVSNMNDSLHETSFTLGNALIPAGKRLALFFTAQFEKLTKVILLNQKEIDVFAQAVVSAFIAISKAFKFVTEVIFNFMKGVKQIISAFNLLLSLPLVKELAQMAVAFYAATKASAAFLVVVKALKGSMLGWISIIVAVGTALGKFSEPIEKGLLRIQQLLAETKVGFYTFVDDVVNKLSSLGNIKGFGWIKDMQDGITGLKESAIKDLEEVNKAVEGIGQEKSKKDKTESMVEQAKAEAAQLAEIEDQFLAEKKEREIVAAEELAMAKNDIEDQFLQDRITADEYKQELDQLKYEQDLVNFQESQIAINELKNEMQATQDETELLALQTKLNLELQAHEKHKEALLQSKIANNKKNKKEDKLFAEFDIKLQKFKQTEIYKDTVIVSDLLVKLKDSESSKLAAIGKAAAKGQSAINKGMALYQIGVDTARGAVSAYAALAPIPFVGPVLGAAAAAAIVAYGVEQAAAVMGMNLFAEGSPNITQDQIAMVHQGEIIVPANFADAIRSGDLSLSGGDGETNATTNNGGNTVIVNFEGANFYGDVDDNMVETIGNRLGEMINEDIIAAIPTREV